MFAGGVKVKVTFFQSVSLVFPVTVNGDDV